MTAWTERDRQWRAAVPAPVSDPVVCGLLRALPPPGAPFPAEKRKLWTETMERVFGLIYHDD